MPMPKLDELVSDFGETKLVLSSTGDELSVRRSNGDLLANINLSVDGSLIDMLLKKSTDEFGLELYLTGHEKTKRCNEVMEGDRQPFRRWVDDQFDRDGLLVRRKGTHIVVGRYVPVVQFSFKFRRGDSKANSLVVGVYFQDGDYHLAIPPEGTKPCLTVDYWLGHSRLSDDETTRRHLCGRIGRPMTEPRIVYPIISGRP